MTIEAKHRKLTVLHVATVNKPIKSDLDYAPIETIIHHIHQGIQSLGHRSIVACSADSRVSGEQYVTVGQSLGEYCGQDTASSPIQGPPPSSRPEIIGLLKRHGAK